MQIISRLKVGLGRDIWTTSTNDNYWTSDSWLEIGANNCSRISRFNGTKPSTLSETILLHHNIERHTIKYKLEWPNAIKKNAVTPINQ